MTQTYTKKLAGGNCRCGAYLPGVYPDETPFEFCTQQCRVEAAAQDLLEAAIAAQIVLAIRRDQTSEAKDIDRALDVLKKAINKAEGRSE